MLSPRWRSSLRRGRRTSRTGLVTNLAQLCPGLDGENRGEEEEGEEEERRWREGGWKGGSTLGIRDYGNG